MAKNVEIIPPNDPIDRNGNGGNSYYVNITNAHLRTNNIDGYRRLAAECGVEFAEKVLESNERQDRRETAGLVIGMISAGLLAIALVLAVTASIILLGWWQSVLVALLLLACGMLMRVLLTGEWSETSWIGKILSGNYHKPDASDD